MEIRDILKFLSDDIYEKIKKLARLKEEGIITEEEFSESKRELLSKL